MILSELFYFPFRTPKLAEIGKLKSEGIVGITNDFIFLHAYY